MRRLAPIEGLRAWLALWVLVCHAMGFSGYVDDGRLAGVPKLLSEGWLAVDVFIIVSGFVIFRLLDTREENFAQFIVRRFFRLYPVYLLLFLLAIPASLLWIWNIRHAPAYQPAGDVEFFTRFIATEWQNWRLNIPAHLAMLHGLVPDAWFGQMPTSRMWLGPAWSISLEWQFYLVAPALFPLATSVKTSHRLFLCALCLVLLSLGHRVEWGIAFLPLHTEFFFVGAASFFLHKWMAESRLKMAGPGLYLTAVCGGWMLYLLSGKVREFIPLGLWLMFFALLLEPTGRPEAGWLRPLFVHPLAQYLGKISYGLYLSHELILVVMQAALLKWLPQLGQPAHFWLLLGLTLPATILASALLHRLIEVPGMKWGRKFADRLGAKTALKPLSSVPATA